MKKILLEFFKNAATAEEPDVVTKPDKTIPPTKEPVKPRRTIVPNDPVKLPHIKPKNIAPKEKKTLDAIVDRYNNLKVENKKIKLEKIMIDLSCF